MARSWYLAAYDIVEDRRRAGALRVLREFSVGGQKSFFECYLSAREAGSLVARVAPFLDGQRDRFFLVRLDPRMKVLSLGIAVPPSTGPFLLSGR